jgi:hypothetical protein
LGAGAGAGREAARLLWPLVLKLWEQHPWFLMVIAGVVAVASSLFLGWIWDIIRPVPWQPHEVYRPPDLNDDDRPDTTGPHHGTGR